MRPFLVITAFVVSSAASAQGFETPARFAFLKDLSTGTVLMAKNADQRVPPASMGKMMTVYVAFDLISRGKASLDQKLIVSPETWRKWHSQGSTMFLGVGEQPTVRDLLHGIVTLSGNDACVVLAEGLAGTEANYVQLMNQAAAKMGLNNSHFANTNGWPDPNEYVSARDLATIAERTVTDHPRLYKAFYGLPNFTWGKTLGAGRDIKQDNRNPILGKVPGADGLKTGHTEEAGYGFTGSAEQNGRRLIMVIGGLPTWNDRVTQSIAFMNWGFNAFEASPVVKSGKVVATAPVYLGSASTVQLVAPKDVRVSVPRGQDANVRVRVEYTQPIKAPIAKGAPVATMVVMGGNGAEARLPLVAGAQVDKAGLFGRIGANIRSLIGG
jgi:D-alanyl-D-alanine carboxypeptidase (penicillin-binding protein 5/6)